MDELNGITILGLGPGDPGLLTRHAWELISNTRELYLRTRHHPVVGQLPASIHLVSFDDYYEAEEDFEHVYARIIERVLELGRRPEGVVYAVPGHPLIAEATGPEIMRRAAEEGIRYRMIEGLSFLEPLLTALGLDPFPHTALVDAFLLADGHVPPFPPNAPAIVAQIHSKLIASNVKLTLTSIYPDEHRVRLVHAAGTQDETIEDLALYEIDRSDHIGLLTALYLPPLGPGTSFEAFQELVAHLRAPEGCPWDRKQTHQTLRSHLLEETYEALTALDADDPDAMREEFGDLLLQIVLHAQIATEYGEFNMPEVLSAIHSKLVRRHPHVFGELDLKDEQGVLVNWEKLKALERAENGQLDKGLLDGIALALPSLVQAEQYQSRAARVGFDWPSIDGVIAKLEEELAEVHAAEGLEEINSEIGDLLFAVVNLARWLKVDPESALREANRRFKQRFAYIEAHASLTGRHLSELSLEEMDALWNQAKK